MPFYKWAIKTSDSSGSKQKIISDDPKSVNYDIDLSASNRMVIAIRHISQLAKIADDVFGSLEFEFRSLLQRTSSLTTRIQTCQSVVDTLNAKTVKVPVSSLTGNREDTRTPFKSWDEKDLGHPPIFCTFPRPLEVENLRRLANGPTPPALIPCGKVAPEADGDTRTSSSSAETTHIYCKPLQIPESRNHKSSVPVENRDRTDKVMTSSVKVPSSTVPINVSGQPFSRMASFRRSLIHVDFFIRRKKKDKRRNTVAEGDTKELKDALQNILNEGLQHPGVPNGTLPKNSLTNGIHKTQPEVSTCHKATIPETNNNSTKEIACAENSTKRLASSDQSKAQTLQNGNLKVDLKNSHNSEAMITSLSNRKAKSHIPISTVSAAMSVAVEMRQLNDIEDKSSSNNWIYSSNHNLADLDGKKTGDDDKESDHRALNGEDSGFSDSYKAYKSRVKEGHKTSVSKGPEGTEETEAFSSASSENTAVQDDETSNATSVESDAFFISSEESDEESSDIFVQKYGSSTSISTMSDGSLNSLLSRTGTEMASSTGTLTSVGFERFPTPPPPPPPFIIVASKNEVLTDSTPHLTKYDKNEKHSSSKPLSKHSMSSKTSKKSVSPQKVPKSSADKCDRRKSSDNSKGIFTSLVSKKSRGKEQNKSKDARLSNPKPEPFIDMYGNSSPPNVMQFPTFIKENRHPMSEVEQKTHLQSFLPENLTQQSGSETENRNSVTNKQVFKDVNVIHEPLPPCFVSTTEIISPNKNIDVPLKYVQQVVVTPISRPSNESNGKNTCRKSLFTDNCDSKQRNESDTAVKSQHYSQPRCLSGERPSGNSSGRPQRPNTLHTGTKAAARVVLDPEGRVIYSTNSLDRRLPYEFPNQCPTARSNIKDQYGYSVPPPPRNVVSNVDSSPQNFSFQDPRNISYGNPNPYFDQHTLKNNTFSTFTNPRNNENIFNFSEYPPSNPNRNCRMFPPNIVIETENRVYGADSQELIFPSPPAPIANTKMLPPPYEEAVSRNCPHILIADPNISGLPPMETMLTEQNLNLHLKNIEQLGRLQIEGTVDSFNSLEKESSSQTCSRSPVDSNLDKLKGSTMSTEDLFAVIHDCKKRMNIKTDSDISSSSRSNSPSYFGPPPHKGNFVETGFLSPRNAPPSFNNTRDRRSWADFRPVSGSPHERKSLASDRLGRAKPTSMHDFKMLLLQARSSTQTSRPRKSAVEMLKIPPSPSTPGGPISSPAETSPYYNKPFSLQNSPTSPSFIHNGHSTVPFKRHNRVRSSLQSRYTMYPPIFEDCSEEAENGRDTVAKPFG